MRQQLMTNHALEVEKLQDRHRSELKRIQVSIPLIDITMVDNC